MNNRQLYISGSCNGALMTLPRDTSTHLEYPTSWQTNNQKSHTTMAGVTVPTSLHTRGYTSICTKYPTTSFVHFLNSHGISPGHISKHTSQIPTTPCSRCTTKRLSLIPGPSGQTTNTCSPIYTVYTTTPHRSYACHTYPLYTSTLYSALRSLTISNTQNTKY